MVISENKTFLFGTGGNEAWIIDFYLAGEAEKTYYPPSYNHYGIEECHRHARANFLRHFVHDSHGLGKFMLLISNPQPQQVVGY